MNSQNAAQYLPLVKALAEGKTIQMNAGNKNSPDWDDLHGGSIIFGDEPSFYRIKPERKTITGFVNVYPGDIGTSIHRDKDLAKIGGSPRRIACVPITITYEEGEGL